MGIDNAELADTSEIGLEECLSYLERAIYCFTKAQSSELVAKAQVHVKSVQLREKLSQTDLSRAHSERQIIEEEAAGMVELLLRENLLLECRHLLNASTRLFSPYTQQKLEEDIVSKIHTTV